MHLKLSEVKLLLIAALPLMGAFLAQKGMQLIDTLMMGWIGPRALAAGALGMSLFSAVLVFCMGTLSAVGVYIARARGANQLTNIKHHLQQGIYLVLFLSLPSMLLIWLIPHFLLKIGEEKQVVDSASLLLHSLVWGFPGLLLFLVLREFVSAFVLTRIIMVITLTSIPLTFITNYALIYGKFGLPIMGVAGIGVSGAMIMWLMFVSLFIYCKQHPLLKNHLPYSWLSVDLRALINMIGFGAPSGLMYLLDMGMFAVAAMMMGHFGENALAAHQITMMCATIAYTTPFALSMATGLQVSHALGANNIKQAKRVAYIGLMLGLMISLSLALFYILEASAIIHLFLPTDPSHYEQIDHLAISFISIAACFQCFDAIQTIFYGALRGLKDTLVPMLMCTSCYWFLGIGSCYYFAFHTSLAANGIWYGLVIGIGGAALVLSLRFRFLGSKTKASVATDGITLPI